MVFIRYALDAVGAQRAVLLARPRALWENPVGARRAVLLARPRAPWENPVGARRAVPQPWHLRPVAGVRFCGLEVSEI